jgi:hypothetical protein
VSEAFSAIKTTRNHTRGARTFNQAQLQPMLVHCSGAGDDDGADVLVLGEGAVVVVAVSVIVVVVVVRPGVSVGSEPPSPLGSPAPFRTHEAQKRLPFGSHSKTGRWMSCVCVCVW